MPSSPCRDLSQVPRIQGRLSPLCSRRIASRQEMPGDAAELEEACNERLAV